jgi:hypothetical protein
MSTPEDPTLHPAGDLMLDDRTVDHLLDGLLGLREVPAEYVAIVGLVRALSLPPSPAELSMQDRGRRGHHHRARPPPGSSGVKGAHPCFGPKVVRAIEVLPGEDRLARPRRHAHRNDRAGGGRSPAGSLAGRRIEGAREGRHLGPNIGRAPGELGPGDLEDRHHLRRDGRRQGCGDQHRSERRPQPSRSERQAVASRPSRPSLAAGTEQRPWEVRRLTCRAGPI